MRCSFLPTALLAALALLGIRASGADPAGADLDAIPPVTAAETPAASAGANPVSAPLSEAAAATPTTNPTSGSVPGSSARPTPGAADPYSDVVLRANDRLQFRIAEDPIRAPSPMGLIVNSIGEVGFPISRDSDVRITLQVRGRTLAQVREEITRKLLEDYYHRATVELSMGEKVLTPGKVQFFGEIQTVLPLSPDGPPLKLSDAILQVQAPEFANLKRVKVHRLNAVTGQTTVLEVNVDAIIKDGQRDKDVILEDGDRVEVKQKWFN
jgi:protein involved in polysaccharide export with SLBB domain